MKPYSNLHYNQPISIEIDSVDSVNSVDSFDSVDSDESILYPELCLIHPENALIYICFQSKVHSEVFHCKICEEECPHDHSWQHHVKLSHLNQSVDQETVISNWPVLSHGVLSRIENALSFYFEDSYTQFQLRLLELYNKFSWQKQFRDIIQNEFLNHQEKSILLVQEIQFVKVFQDEIDEEFSSLLNHYESSRYKLVLFNQILTNEQEQKVNLNEEEEDYEKESENSPQQLKNRYIKLKISNLNKLETYDIQNSLKEKENIIYKISRMPNLKNLNLYLRSLKFNSKEVKSVVDSLAYLPNLTNLFLSLENINHDSEEAKSLADSLTCLTNLTNLSLRFCNKFGSEEIKYLNDQLKRLPNLHYYSLDLLFTNISDRIAKQISCQIKKLKRLVQFNIDSIYF